MNGDTPSSPQEKSRLKTLFEVGLVEIFFVIGFIVLIAVTLNYFNIISLSQLSPFLSFLPHRQNQTATTQRFRAKDIQLQSNVNGYEVSLANKKELIALFSNWKIFETSFNLKNGANTRPVEIIIITITDDKMQFTLPKNVPLSNSTYLYGIASNNTLQLFLYISPDIFSKSKTVAEKTIQRQILDYIYSLSPLSISQSKNTKDEIVQQASQRNYFRVQKR